MKYFPENVILVLFTILVTINSINTIPVDPIVLYKKVPCAESCVITFEDYIKNRQTLIFDYYLQNNDYVFEKSTNPGLAWTTYAGKAAANTVIKVTYTPGTNGADGAITVNFK